MKNNEMNNYDIENEYSEIIVRNVLKSIFNNIDHQIFIRKKKIHFSS